MVFCWVFDVDVTKKLLVLYNGLYRNVYYDIRLNS